MSPCRCSPLVVASCLCSSDSTTTINENGDGSSGFPFTYDLIISAFAGNTLTTQADGAYVPGFTLKDIIVHNTGTGIYTPSANTLAIVFAVIGGGGGGGGAESDGVDSGCGGGGGGGAYSTFFDTTLSATYYYSVGGAGNGGAAGNNNGGDGGDTFIKTVNAGGTTICHADRGHGGFGGGHTSEIGTGGDGGLGGDPGAGDFGFRGEDGSRGVVLKGGAGYVVISGRGGGAARGSGGRRSAASLSGLVTGLDGHGPGGGASGGAAVANAAGAPGGNGAEGLVVIYEYGA